MIHDEIRDQKRSKRDEVRMVEGNIREKIFHYKESRVKQSKEIYQQRVVQVSTMMVQKSEEIQNLEALESHKLQALQMTKKLEEERITKFEKFMETQKQMQERRLNQQMEKLYADKIKYRSPINLNNTSTMSVGRSVPHRNGSDEPSPARDF